jgi:outer membrane protein assembly factor BamB
LALNEELHSLDKQTGKTNWTYEFDDFEISSFSSFALKNGQILLGTDEDDFVLFDLEDQNIVWQKSTPVEDTFIPRIYRSIGNVMYDYNPDGKIFAFSYDKNGVNLIWKIDMETNIEWISADETAIYLWRPQQNQLITIDGLSGSLMNTMELIWDSGGILEVNKNSVFGLSQNQIFCQNFLNKGEN